MVETVREAFRSAAGHTGAEPLFEAGNDAEPALTGSLGDLEGYLLVAGTGSIAYGRTRAGRTARAGGWGHHLGDEGSAYWIAFEGVKRGIRSAEGRERASGLIDAAIAHFSLPDMPSLIPFVYKHFNKARIASFAPTVARMAEDGDPLAREILDGASMELVSLVESVHARLAADIVHQRLALHGGLMDKNGELREAVINRLRDCLPQLEIVPAAGDAPEGACRLARMLLSPDRSCR
jgi:N-acetylglucosamine kinase-like BadF-type ATPase